MIDESPPREWLVEHFTDDGRVTFCPICRGVPLIALAGGCACGADRTIASIQGWTHPWITEDLDETRLWAAENEDRPGSWYCFYAREGVA
jgi:hypothetical protein